MLIPTASHHSPRAAEEQGVSYFPSADSLLRQKLQKKSLKGLSWLMLQWLRLHVPNAGDLASITLREPDRTGCG